MTIQIYNTLTRKTEPFQPVDPPNVGIYLCGPTVYKPSHIGHTVGPIIFDAIVRYLKHRGYEVRWVVNITDVDDKLIAEADAQGRDMLEIAREVEEDYKDCLAQLAVENITDWPRATECIDDIIALVKSLVDKGAAYAVDGDVYFDHTARDDYGKLSGRSVEEARAGTRDLEGSDKKHPADFALWKAAKPGEPGWDSPWGPGRPGWHIECSAMSMKLLGETFDIHGGGMDLIFPHHENEIAQSEAASGTDYVKYWMHNGLTRIKTKANSAAEKMSKSLGNIRTIRSLLDQYAGETIRAFVLSTHYRRPLDFSDQQLEATARGLDNFYRLFERIEALTGLSVYETGGQLPESAGGETDSQLLDALARHEKRFYDAMDDDFNTAGAIAAMHEMVSSTKKWLSDSGLEADPSDTGKAQLLAAAGRKIVTFGRLLGLFIVPPVQPGADQLDDAEIDRLLQERKDARANKDFARADQIRDQLAEAGIEIMDSAGGTTWRRK
ncbi:MAG: cysteine--tRNA ligase [Phycisphaerae bacterium]